MVRDAGHNDSDAIAGIYNYYVKNTTVTFEEEEVSAGEMQSRVSDVQEKYPWLVYELNNEIAGYAYAGPWKSRCAYRYSVEVSVYLRDDLPGKGFGTALYDELLLRLQKLDVHGVIGGMALPNDACLALHKKFGFEQVAHFKEVGYKFDRWIDVIYLERIL